MEQIKMTNSENILLHQADKAIETRLESTNNQVVSYHIKTSWSIRGII